VADGHGLNIISSLGVPPDNLMTNLCRAATFIENGWLARKLNLSGAVPALYLEAPARIEDSTT
jgi:hypothetical protein